MITTTWWYDNHDMVSGDSMRHMSTREEHVAKGGDTWQKRDLVDHHGVMYI